MLEHFINALFSKTALIALVLNYFIAKLPLWKCVLLWIVGSSSKVCWELLIWPPIEPFCYKLCSLFKPP